MSCNVDRDKDDAEWLQAAASNPAFADLADPAEDIYSLADGIEFRDEATQSGRRYRSGASQTPHKPPSV